MPDLFDRCHAALMVHEVAADPMDPKLWTGGAVGDGEFMAPNGGLDLNAADRGNWTGGSIGSGLLGGTRWGISTAAYPDLLKSMPGQIQGSYPTLVKDLPFRRAKDLARYAFWDKLRCAELPGPVALLQLDDGFNTGVGAAIGRLQSAVGAKKDGVFGTGTMTAVQAQLARGGAVALARELLALRIDAMAMSAQWPVFGLGWSRRLAKLPFQAMALAA